MNDPKATLPKCFLTKILKLVLILFYLLWNQKQVAEAKIKSPHAIKNATNQNNAII